MGAKPFRSISREPVSTSESQLWLTPATSASRTCVRPSSSRRVRTRSPGSILSTIFDGWDIQLKPFITRNELKIVEIRCGRRQDEIQVRKRVIAPLPVTDRTNDTKGGHM